MAEKSLPNDLRVMEEAQNKRIKRQVLLLDGGRQSRPKVGRQSEEEREELARAEGGPV